MKIGITSSTGNATENHDILGWRYCSKAFIDDKVTSYNEPVKSDIVELISISPNPASDYIEISYPPSEKRGLGGVSVRIYDLLGVEQLPRPDGHPFMLEGEVVRIDVSSLQPGVYFVRVGDVVRKFIKF